MTACCQVVDSGIKRSSLKDDTALPTAENRAYIRAQSDIYSFRAKICCPVCIEVMQIWEGDHWRQVGKQCVWIIVPELEVRIMKQPLEDCTRHIRGLVSLTDKLARWVSNKVERYAELTST